MLTSGAVLTPSNAPPDLPVYNGTVVTSVCGSCCQRSSYCGSTASDTVIAADDPPLSEGDVIPKGTNMTCYLQDRSAAGSVDGGEISPSTCQGARSPYFLQTFPGSAAHRVAAKRVYEATTVLRCWPTRQLVPDSNKDMRLSARYEIQTCCDRQLLSAARCGGSRQGPHFSEPTSLCAQACAFPTLTAP